MRNAQPGGHHQTRRGAPRVASEHAGEHSRVRRVEQIDEARGRWVAPCATSVCDAYRTSNDETSAPIEAACAKPASNVVSPRTVVSRTAFDSVSASLPPRPSMNE